MNRDEFSKWIEQKPYRLLDGATGTNLQSMGLPIGAVPEAWVLTNPGVILKLHQQFIQAGSEVILTCTFGGNRVRLKNAGLEAQLSLINRQAVSLAKQAAQDKETLIAGSIGPIGELMEPNGNLTEALAFDIYHEQARILLDSGVDLLVIETQYDLQEALSAIQAVRSVSTEIALGCSFSFDRGERSFCGLSPEKAVPEINQSQVDVFGINCGKDLSSNLKVLKTTQTLTEKPIWFKPNAGYPIQDEDGSLVYQLSPDELSRQVPLWADNGAKLIGGCCGTEPDKIKIIKDSLKNHFSVIN